VGGRKDPNPILLFDQPFAGSAKLQASAPLTEDPDLHLLVDGRMIRGTAANNDAYLFALTMTGAGPMATRRYRRRRARALMDQWNCCFISVAAREIRSTAQRLSTWRVSVCS
jgi:hypothetical protein